MSFGSAALVFMAMLSASSPPFTGFDDFLQRYEAEAAKDRPALAASFVEWQQSRGGFPIRQADGSVVFFYLGEDGEKSVSVAGDFISTGDHDVNWQSAGESMSNVGEVYFQRRRFEPDARLDYAYVIDGTRKRDPLNPRHLFSGVGGGDASELAMPAHRTPQETVERDAVAKGTLQVVQEAWATPRITVYLPPGYDRARRYPTLYTADGSAWIGYMKLPTTLDNMIADGSIRPVVAVMIDAAEDRRNTYYFNDGYLDYLRRVVEYVDSHYATLDRPGERVHAGSSAGGRITLHAGLELPALIGNIAMLSPVLDGPFSYYEPYVAGRRQLPKEMKVWLSAGSYEGGIYHDTQAMAGFLRNSGIDTQTVYLHQGHSFGAWREVTPRLLRHFFGR